MTPKGTKPGEAGHPAASRRYTPPAPTGAGGQAPSPAWVPILMVVLIALGALVIVVNYIVWSNNAYLGLGLLLVFAGIITATQWR